MTKKVTPFLWFDDQAEEAAKFYLSVFKGSKITSVFRQDGKVLTIAFTLSGQDFIALNGGPQHKFTEAVSFVVTCKTQREIDSFWRKLTQGGGQPGPCGWLKDKYGLSWQIVPEGVAKLLKTPAAMQEMMTMGKLEIKRLKRAAKA